jgi:hypothetical protein
MDPASPTIRFWEESVMSSLWIPHKQEYVFWKVSMMSTHRHLVVTNKMRNDPLFLPSKLEAPLSSSIFINQKLFPIDLVLDSGDLAILINQPNFPRELGSQTVSSMAFSRRRASRTMDSGQQRRTLFRACSQFDEARTIETLSMS